MNNKIIYRETSYVLLCFGLVNVFGLFYLTLHIFNCRFKLVIRIIYIICLIFNNFIRCNSISMNILSLRCKIFCNCILNCTAICQRSYRLYDTFSKCLSSNNLTNSIILYGTCKYLRSACTVTVY